MQDKKSKQRGARKVGVVPDWFKNKEQEVPENTKATNTAQQPIDFEEQRRKLLEQLNSD